VGALYVTLYGCARFFTEYFRTPDFEKTFFGITLSSGQLYSLPMIVAGLLMLAWAYRHNKPATPASAPSATR
jgi:phosphatidylglycerol:prolipoprotein diacylglycerol transferase